MASAAKYFGTYTDLRHTDDTTEVKLDGNYCAIGRETDFVAEMRVTSRGKERPRVTVAATPKMAAGFLEPQLAAQVLSMEEDGWDVHICPSLVVFDKPKDRYICEVAIVAYPAAQRAAFEPFTIRLFERIAKGEHPQVKLSAKQLAHVEDSGGAWCKTESAPRPKLPKACAVYKDRMTKTERMATQAVKRPRGCYIALAVGVVLVALLVFYIVSR